MVWAVCRFNGGGLGKKEGGGVFERGLIPQCTLSLGGQHSVANFEKESEKNECIGELKEFILQMFPLLCFLSKKNVK